MKRTTIKILLISILHIGIIAPLKAYNITVRINLHDGSELFLCRHVGDNTDTLASAKVSKGKATFKCPNTENTDLLFVKDAKQTYFYLLSPQKKAVAETNTQNPQGDLVVCSDQQCEEFNNIIKDLVNGYNFSFDQISASKNEKLLAKLLSESEKQDNSQRTRWIMNALYIRENQDYKIDTSSISLANSESLSIPFYAQNIIDRYCDNFVDKYAYAPNAAFKNIDVLLTKNSINHEANCLVMKSLINRYKEPKDLRLEKIFCYLFENHYPTNKSKCFSDYEFSQLTWKLSVTQNNLVGNKGEDIS
ncbi:MAG: hypothetical protein HUK15_00225, partial [Bacteroidales bacterium]|nr:hypothetical protein [Bacteroidales bacterium]